ncbi:RNA polymerase sigma-70 factor (ECF subfamily) [Arenicella xantha]|uniref:RNA polymerase sigma-70 factor (ECF subfamily) n=2 Tax=Arenicella xantha TaxID=644221 RepID=A0A395JJT4_9GAMM|nr:RNA polymerase sigma-70 factor (ECF subfamily) [Arenicella xantha]
MRDESLMAAYAKGDAIAFDELYARHKHAVFQFLRRQCPSVQVCEELVQDTWLAVIHGAPNYQPTAQFRTWLYRMAHNRLVDHWRRFGSSSNVLFEELSDALAVLPDTTTREIELDDLLLQLEQLPQEQVETLLLKTAGFSHTEIADITSTKPETVKSRLRYATQRLRVSMGVAS